MTKAEAARIKNRVAAYNSIPNLLWSVICISPIFVFCYSFMSVNLICTFLIVSMLSLFFPKSFFDKLQLAKTMGFYKKSGVIFLNKFTQNGVIINSLIRRKYPDYKTVSKKNRSIEKLFQQTYLFEKFHFLALLFFAFTSVYALFKSQYWWALLITLTNIIYNIYPILLQQYIRLRLSFYKKKSEHEKKQFDFENGN